MEMTKEETIKDLVDIMKNGHENPLDAYCHTHPCLTCPFFQEDESGECAEGMVNELIDRLIKVEESQKAETNLEHFFEDSDFTDGNGYIIKVRLPWNIQTDNLTTWLLSPYEKPKYKLTKFEYDLLKCYSARQDCVRNRWELCRMYDKGYFKDIPNDIRIKEILDNCEVVEE